MKNIQCQLENGKRALFNLDRIDAIIEHGINPKNLTVVCFGAESWTVRGTFDDILKQMDK